MRTITSLVLLWLIGYFSISARAVEHQSFENEAEATAAGWTGAGNQIGGQAFGFSATNHTGFTDSPASEAGGRFVRTLSMAFYGDTTIGGPYSLSDALEASGEIAFTGHETTSQGLSIFIGFFNRSAAGLVNPRNILGMSVAEPLTGNQYRIDTTIALQIGAPFPLEGPDFALANGNTNYRWSFDYDPAGNSGLGLLSAQFFDNGGGLIGGSMLSLTPIQCAMGATFDSFGVLTVNSFATGPESITLYIDDVSYSAVPEPVAGCPIVAALGMLSLFRRSRSRGPSAS